MAEIKKEIFKGETDYTRKDKKEKKELKPIISSDKIVSTKKPFSKRMIKFFLDEDIEDVKGWLIHEIILPELKEMGRGVIANAFGIDYKPSRSGDTYHRDYRAYYRGSGSKKKNDGPKRDSRFDDEVDYRNIILEDRRDAEELVDRMRYQIEYDGTISVAEFLNLLHLPSEWTDSDWGWNNPNDIGIKKVHNGFRIDVREARRID